MQNHDGASSGALMAGAATADITPEGSVFLFGYPHVPRDSTGVHDRLECAALYLRNGRDEALFLANDLIFVGKRLATAVRVRVSVATGVPFGSIAVTATHTHSGPVTVDYVSNSADPVVPKADRAYLSFIENRMVEAACAAVRNASPAEAGLAVARAEGVGTNRHDPRGSSEPDVPVLMVRARGGGGALACMVVHAMHTTVLHEDSTLISGDYPHFAREYLRREGLVPRSCPILHHNGASGNQSPRHVTKANTFEEARRLGEMLGREIARVVPGIVYSATLPLRVTSAHLEPVARELPAVATAEAAAAEARARFEKLKAGGAARTLVRGAECDWFGAEETVALARAAHDGRRDEAVRRCSPLEVQVIELGAWSFVMWPGEFFVEYALQVRARFPRAFVITMANGELQGYIVTPAAEAAGVYEATNALFSPHNGERVVRATLDILKSHAASPLIIPPCQALSISA